MRTRDGRIGTGRRIRLAVGGIVTVLVVGIAAALVWVNTPLRGERGPALEAWRDPAVSITAEDGRFVMTPTGDANGAGLVFLPGAKVDPSAYLYKLSGLVDAGVTVVVAEVPLGIAFTDTRTTADLTAGVAGVDRWFVGGHSLGGVRACDLAAEAAGLVLFGSYCATDLAGTAIPVLSIAAEFDGLSTPAKIAAAAPLLPATTRFEVVAGANHAGFGDYGPQARDGTATIDDATMRDAITRLALPFLAG